MHLWRRYAYTRAHAHAQRAHMQAAVGGAFAAPSATAVCAWGL